MAFSFPESTTSGDHNNITIADGPYLTLPNSDWSLGGFLKYDDNLGSNFQYHLSWGNFGASPSINWFIDEASGSNAHKMKFDINGTSSQFSDETPGESSNFQHVLLVRSGNTVTLWIAGSATSTTITLSAAVDVSGDLHLGCRSDDNAQRRFGGDMAEWAKWDVALTAAQINALANDRVSPLFFPGGLAYYVPMVREEVELLNNPTTSSADLTVAPHPRIYRPSGHIYVPAAAAAVVTSTGTVILQATTIAGVGVMLPSGAGVLTLAAAVIAGVGVEAIPGTGVITLLATTLVGAGILAIPGTGILVLDAPTISSVGVMQPSGSGVLVLDAVALSAVGVQTIPGTATIVIDAATLAGVGVMQPSGSGVITLDVAIISATGIAGVATGTGVLTLDQVALAAEGVMLPSGTGTITLDVVVLAGVGVAPAVVGAPDHRGLLRPPGRLLH